MRAEQGIMVAAILAGLGGPASAVGYSCPPSVMDKGAVKTADGKVDPPWALHAFRFAAFYEGDPKSGAALTPAEELKSDRLVQVWRVNTNPGRVTVVCRYTGTSRVVQAVLPAGLRRCTVVTMNSGDPPPQLHCD